MNDNFIQRGQSLYIPIHKLFVNTETNQLITRKEYEEHQYNNLIIEELLDNTIPYTLAHLDTWNVIFRDAAVMDICYKVRNDLPTFKYYKTHENAIAPYKNRGSNVGFDLHLIRKIKEVKGIHYYDTGISVQTPNGYYFDVVGHSSISKTGWMLANNISIIDNGYTDSIIVALVAINDTTKPLELPCKLVQLILRENLMFKSEESDVPF